MYLPYEGSEHSPPIMALKAKCEEGVRGLRDLALAPQRPKEGSAGEAAGERPEPNEKVSQALSALRPRRLMKWPSLHHNLSKL